jgi:hypothetical protein
MRLVGIFMWFTPIGIISLIAGNLLELEDLSDTAAVLLLYVNIFINSTIFNSFC